MGDVVFRFNSQGVADLLKGAEVQKAVQTEADHMAGRARSKNPGGVYDVLSGVGRNRAFATVATSNTSPKTRIQEARNHYLRNSIAG